MNKNSVKIAIVVVCLAAAGLLILWNAGVIGGGSSGGKAPTGQAPVDNPDANADKPTEHTAGTLVKDRE